MATNEFGRYYWWIRLTNGQEVGVYADRVEVTSDGTLVLYGGSQSAGAKFVNLAVGAGEWQLIYAASAEDSRPLAVEHWQKRRS